MPIKKKTFNQDAAIRGALRRVFSRSPVVREVLFKVRREVPKYNKDGSRAKKNAVQYLCNVCQKYAGSTKVAVDHIEPVISVDEGFVDFNMFIARLFCKADNLQVICEKCHKEKTYLERITRLKAQYMAELDSIEAEIKAGTYDTDKVLLAKLLKKYIAKKKTPDLKPIVQRALLIEKKFKIKKEKS